MKTKHFILLLSAAMLAACSQKLDIPQHGVITTDTYYQTDSDAQGAVTAIYTALAGRELSDHIVLNLLSDDFWAGATNYTALHSYNDFSFDADESYLASFFTEHYNVIGRCNILLDKLKPDTDFKAQCIAEAKVARAWMYFSLTTLWGNPPLVDHCLDADEAKVGNSTPEKLWEFIEKDLNDAISSGKLTSKASLEDKSNYRLTREYAYALLGKALLWQKKYEQAATAFEEVTGSGLYKLFDGAYGDMGLHVNDNNCESLFESNWILDDANPGACTRLYPMVSSLSYSTRTLSENALGLNYAGWGMCTPTRSLYDAFVAEEGTDGYRLNQTLKDYAFMKGNGYGLIAGSQEQGDGLFMWKQRYTMDDTGAGFPLDWGSNIRWMRYAEVLLLSAEANLLAGNQEKADACLNEVRSRAKLPAKTATLSAIKTEKRLELCGESCRYLDVLRWGDAPDIWADRGATFPYLQSDGSIKQVTTPAIEHGYKTGKHERLPYPYAERLVNPNLTQNPGWVKTN